MKTSIAVLPAYLPGYYRILSGSPAEQLAAARWWAAEDAAVQAAGAFAAGDGPVDEAEKERVHALAEAAAQRRAEWQSAVQTARV